jgi:serine/threonine protein kinase
MIGQTISHYKILDKLGEGGMGVVYKALDTKLDRTVALKFLPKSLAASEADRARFLQEARAAASLDNANICTIYGIEEYHPSGASSDASAQLFIAMAYVEGTTLREKLPTLSQKQAIDIAIQAADGLAAAHDKGIVHRDIKPENIMLRKDGVVQIMDFGLAKLRESSSKINRLTKQGSTVGTAGYMSPEQVQGMDADHRSDIFSFGVLLYELLTGQLPFRGVHETALAYEIVNVDPAPMASLMPEIDPALDAIVLECLEKDVNERAQSVRQVAVDLKKYKRESSRQRVSRITASRPAMQVSGTGSGATVAAGYPSGVAETMSGESVAPFASDRSGISKLTAIVAVLGVVATLVLLFAWSPWKGAPPPTGITRTSVPLPDGYELDLNWIGSPVDISPDGRMIAFRAFSRDSGDAGIFIRPIDSYTAKRITGGFSTFIKFSPDGKWIYYFNGSLFRVSIDGGAPVRVSGAENPRGIDFGADGSIYMAGGQVGGVLKIRPGTDSAEVVSVPDRDHKEISHRFPSILPDGRAMLLTVKYTTTASFDDANIVVHDFETGKNTTVIEGGSHASYVPTGHILYVRKGSFFIAPFDPETRTLTGPTRELFGGGQLMSESGAASYAFSRNGTLVYAPGGPAPSKELVVDWLYPDMKTTPLITERRSYGDIQLSPDGTRIALQVNAANNDIWTWDIRQKVMQRLTFGGGNHGNPVWTADGRRVVFAAERDGEVEIHWAPWNGSGKEEKLLGEKGVSLYPAWCSPDGRSLLYSRVQNNHYDIWGVSLDSARTTRPVLETPFTEFNPRVSPNGRWLSYESAESGRSELYIVPYPTGEGRWQITSGGADASSWNREGSEIFYFEAGKFIARSLKGTTSVEPGASRVVADFGKASDLRLVDGTFDPVNTRWAMIRELPGASAPKSLNVVTGWFGELHK